MTREPTRPIVLAVMAGHFASAFAALGMPPFFVLILERSLHNDAPWLAGWAYVLPTAFAALSAPVWGRLADRYGKKRLLIRAQLGLAASFVLAGYAPNTWTFCAALALQGVMGGTFAASNAYLSTVLAGAALARSLTAMQWSARAALVAAPLGIGAWLGLGWASPIELYRPLALLPLAAALLASRLPADGGQRPAASRARPAIEAVPLQPHHVHALQFAFVFATVVSFPYFAAQVQRQFADLSSAAAGLLFGLPHAAYLVLAPWLGRRLASRPPLPLLSAAFALLAASLLGQAAAPNLPALVLARLAMGLAMTTAYVALHALIAAAVHAGDAGRSFGWFDSSAKGGAVAAGVSAGLAVDAFGTAAPWLLGAAVIAIAATAALLLPRPLRA